MPHSHGDFLVRSEEITDFRYGHYPGSRKIEDLLKSGFILLDKWPGITSRGATNEIKKLFSCKKVGHSGTLDPMVTGVLPLTLDNACKIMPALQGLDKEYTGTMKLHKDVDRKILEATVAKFVGRIRQRPPKRSAVARVERERTVHSFDIIGQEGRDVRFNVHCEAGTYVRMLCHTIGQEIGGAHMAGLRRVRVGRFLEERCIKLADIIDAVKQWRAGDEELLRDIVLPVEAAVEHIGKIIIKDSAVAQITNGAPLYATGICKVQEQVSEGSLVAIITLKGELVALGKAAVSADRMVKGRGLCARTTRVVMEKDVYSN